jgi:hypothetical protein
VEPGGRGGDAGVSVDLIFGEALEAPPMYLSVVVHPVWYVPKHLALVVVNAIRRNTKIDLETPAAAPTESLTRITNE